MAIAGTEYWRNPTREINVVINLRTKKTKYFLALFLFTGEYKC
jgi:hypothetical protein